jgi:hypothetical protein
MLNARVAWKYVMSFLKPDWILSDYPIRVRHFKIEPARSTGHRKPIAVEAAIINWWQMSGHGATEAEALSNLTANLNARKARGERFPRPGTGLPIEFSSTSRIEQHPELAAKFVEKILGLNYRECFISDESSLWDFHAQEDNQELHEKILRTYGVDVSDIEGAKLADIFKRLASKGISA